MYFKRIRDLREDHDFTQEDIARILGCHTGVYQRYEAGTRDIPIWALIRLAELYNVTTDYILGVSDNKSRHFRD